LLFHEVGRFMRAYRIEIKTSEGLRFEMSLGSWPGYATSRLARLFLVANIHKLPLRMASSVSAGSGCGAAAAIGCFLSVAGFFGSAFCAGCVQGAKKDGDFEKHWPAIAAYMNDSFIIMVTIYTVPVLMAFMLLEVHSRWRLRGPESVLGGALAVDFAAAPPALEESETARPSPARPPGQKTGPLKPPPSTAAEPPPPAASPAKPAPAAVALPDSILEAFGDDEAPSPPPPGAALVPCPECGHPNRSSEPGVRCEECGAPLAS
jgi:hypothetical protein